jgi:hypothetical protein
MKVIRDTHHQVVSVNMPLTHGYVLQIVPWDQSKSSQQTYVLLVQNIEPRYKFLLVLDCEDSGAVIEWCEMSSGCTLTWRREGGLYDLSSFS